MVIDNFSTPSAAEIYAQRYPSAVTQVSVAAQRRFVICEDDCPGATPKTPMANLNATVAQRARDKLRARLRADGDSGSLLAANQTPAEAGTNNAAASLSPNQTVLSHGLSVNQAHADESGKRP